MRRDCARGTSAIATGPEWVQWEPKPTRPGGRGCPPFRGLCSGFATSGRRQEYQRSLPLEHYTEATAQATQREITLESLALVKARRTDLHVFNELPVQYPYGRAQKIRQVVPDNMLVLYAGPIRAEGSYDLPFQPCGPLVVLEYVSRHNEGKDYEDNHRRYERELRVPYYLLFYPDTRDLTLFHLRARRYVSVKPNTTGRLAIPELDLEVALLQDWVRYWHLGELLSLPAELQRELNEARLRLNEARVREAQLQLQIEQQRQARLQLERENAELRAQLGRPSRRPRKES